VVVKLENVKKQPFFRQTWFILFTSGIILLAITDLAFIATANPNYLPTVILLGASLVPVTFVAYIYQRVPIGEIPLGPIAVAFLWGGALGTVLAGLLEYSAVRQMGAFSVIGVGIVEETAKLVIPVIIFLQARYLHEADGLLFGIAAGMGFAALETMGYGFVSYIQSQGSTGALNQVLLVRGMLSPAGHAAWTGIICSSLWRQRTLAGHTVFNCSIVGAFIAAVVLHSLWDILGTISSILGSRYSFLDYIGLTVIGVVSFILLIDRLSKAKHLPPI
jgi:RsiW-degrading membrane proteinase PrsW (M82 family)